jgi:magnesium chelatase family protein
MDARLLRRHVRLDPEAERPLLDAYRRGDLSARGRDRTLRVARTIADLAGAETVVRDHVVAALGYRHDAGAMLEVVA